MELVRTTTRIVNEPTQKIRTMLLELIPDLNMYEVQRADGLVIGYDIPSSVKTSTEVSQFMARKCRVLTTASLAGTWIKSFAFDSSTIFELTAFRDSCAVKARVR